MPSSGSTRSPRPDGPIPLFVRILGEDHPKACTGRRVLARGLARPLAGNGSRPIVLDPHADHPLSGTDRTTATRSGILAVDCSWNQLGERGGLPDSVDTSVRGAPHRRLPILLAANPQHYGRPTELNTVEALAAAAFLMGRTDQAEALLAGFRGGPEFLTINRERLGAYRDARTSEDVRTAERRLFGGDPSG